MDVGELTRLTVEALYLVLLVSAPVMGVSLLVGLLVGLLQAATQVQEHTLAFVPKLVAVGATLALAGGWMGAELLRYTDTLFRAIPLMVR